MEARTTDQDYTATRRQLALDVSYTEFTRALESLLGRMDLDALGRLAGASPELVRKQLESFVGPSGFTVFQKLDHGLLLASLAGQPGAATTYVFGNALIAIEMTRHDARAGLYVPLRVFVREEGPGRTLVTYDLPSTQLGQFGAASREITATARMLDAKVEKLIDDALGAARRAAAPAGAHPRT